MIINNMRTAALDISKYRIGIAISDENNEFITYEKTLFLKKEKYVENFNFKKARNKILNEIKKIFEYYKPQITFIGLPTKVYNLLNNNYSYIKNFAHSIRYIIGKYYFIEEDFSTQIATEQSSIIDQNKPMDQVVAKLLWSKAKNINNII